MKLAIISLLPTAAPGGDYAADFLDLGAGTRALAMGGAFVAVADDATAAYWNPAGLPALARRGQLSLTHMEAFSGLAQYDGVHFALKLQRSTALALSGLRYAVEDIPLYGALEGSRLDRIRTPSLRSSGQPEGFTTDVEQAGLLSVARAIPFTLTFGGGLYPVRLPSELSIGMTYKVIAQHLAGATGRGGDMDVGVLLRIYGGTYEGGGAGRIFSIGICGRNLSESSLTWDTPGRHRDALPRGVRLGWAYTQYTPWMGVQLTLAADLDYGYVRSSSYGGEVRMRRAVALRYGVQEGEWRAGAGLTLWRFQIDYAFVPDGLGDSHRVSAVLDF